MGYQIAYRLSVFLPFKVLLSQTFDVFIGIDLLPEIIEKYGNEIAGIIIGPYDMSVMLGTPKVIGSPVMLEAIRKVFDICNAYGKSCGIFCDDEILSKKYKDMGANVFWACTDNVFFLRGFNQVFDALAEME